MAYMCSHGNIGHTSRRYKKNNNEVKKVHSTSLRREASPERETLIGSFSSREEKHEQWRYYEIVGMPMVIY